MRRPGRVTVIGNKFNSEILLVGSGRDRRLKNWYLIDKGVEDRGCFSWGYAGMGPRCTAYSILRELFGRKAAQDECDDFLYGFVALVPQGAVLWITGDEIWRMLNFRTGKE